MSSIKVGKLPSGAECIASQDIGKFNVRVIVEKDGSCWYAYSFENIRLGTATYDSPAGNREKAMQDFNLTCHVLQNAHACYRQSIRKMIDETIG